MTFLRVAKAVQRYPLSPPPSPSENEDADSAKTHVYQQQSEDLTLQNPTPVLLQQLHPEQNGAVYGSRSTWYGDRKAGPFEGEFEGQSAGKAYGHEFECGPKATAYYGYHGGWADWQQGQKEWDSSYPPPRPQSRPGQYTRESSAHQHPPTPPAESFTASHCYDNGYAYSQTQSPGLITSLSQQTPLTQQFFSSAPRNSTSRMAIDDEPEEDYIESNQGNDEDYVRPTTRSQTDALKTPAPKRKPRQPRERKAQPEVKKAQPESVELLRVSQDAHIDKHARYREVDVPGAITTGNTVRVRVGPHKNLRGVVKSSTKNGANVELPSKNKILNFSKMQLELVDVSSREDAVAEAIPIAATTPLATTHNALPAAAAAAPPFGTVGQAQQALARDMTGLQLGAPFHALPTRPSKGASPLRSFAGSLPAIPAATGATAAGQSPSRQSGQPKVYSVPRPMPSHAYMAAAYQQPMPSSISCPLLVILDLNGTLLFRKNKGSNFHPRPHLDEFLEYLFSNHVVMVWSSAKPYNVVNMCQKFFSPEQFKRVAAIWTRDNLRLTPQAYIANTQVYKQLSWVWADWSIQSTNPVRGGYWDQNNTVLLDDSVEKSASEPFNLVQIEEFGNRPDQANEDVLPQVALYLDTLREQKNVSAYIRTKPFVPDRSMPRAAAEAFQVARYAEMMRHQPSPFLQR